ncbi:MAG: PKD domain-containing protein, partial [Bacteroidetes bacterium]|nr:PKD domain-containing protein [Bacteroidota bacterium]
MQKLLLLLISVLVLNSNLALSQCLLTPISTTDKVINASVIIEGKVIAKKSFWDSKHKLILTKNKIEVYKVFKGTVSGKTIDIITEGGVVGNDMLVVEPSLQLELNDVGVFTCVPTKAKIPFGQKSVATQYDAYASVQGFIKYDLDNLKANSVFDSFNDINSHLYPTITSITQKPYTIIKKVSFTLPIQNQLQSNPAITNISPTTATAGTKTVLTITGTGFGTTQGVGTVGFKNADNGGSSYINPHSTQYLSWSDTQIQVEIPTKAGTGIIQVTQGSSATSTQTLTINYAHLNVNHDPGSGTQAYEVDHISDNGSGGYTWQMYTGFDADASAKASFLRAFETWRCGTYINWTIGSTTSTNSTGSDGVNVIRFDSGAELSVGVLGTCYSYRSGCNPGSGIIWYVTELDIVFDDGATWGYGPAAPAFSEYDFETVALHELGHGHQLGHVISSGAIMHYAISNGTSNRTLGTNDLNGGNYVQAKSIVANACGPGAMTNYTGCTVAPVAAFTVNSTTLCPNGTVSFTDQSTNTPTSWSWVFQGGTPSTSTVQNPTISYSALGVYSVTLTATNGAGSDSEIKAGYITVTSSGCIATTSLSAGHCGSSPATYLTPIYFDNVQGASDYEILLTNSSLGYSKSTTLGKGWQPYFYLVSYNDITTSTTYSVQVRAKVGSSWGSYGTSCNITTPALPTTSLTGGYCGYASPTYLTPIY